MPDEKTHKNSFPTIDVLAACAKFGQVLKIPAALDGERVSIAIAAVESGGGDVRALGHDCGPRYEKSYDIGGHNCNAAQQALIRRYGRAACCSYGPWQTMLINCPGYSPAELETDLEKCARCFVSHFNSYVAGFKPSTLRDIGQIWNAGHKSVNPAPGVVAYCNELEKAYESGAERCNSIRS